MAGHVDEATLAERASVLADRAARRALGVPVRSRKLAKAQDRGPSICIRRETIFRRCLLGADILAVVCALTAAVSLAAGATPARIVVEIAAAVPLLLVAAKLSGLYDRDDTLLRKTTLDEAPQLFQLATLCALAVWLVGSLPASARADRDQALLLWPSLAALLIVGRALARGLALRLAPAERCLFIGDERSARMVGAKLSGHCGINAELVAHVDLDQVSQWSTDTCSASRLEQIRDLARTLDVHRAIIAPGWGAEADAGDTLNLVRTLKAVGVRVSVLPRMLEVVGSAVEFDDLHGVALMGVRRFDLTRSSRLVKRGLDLLGVTVGLIVVAPLLVVFSIAIKLDSRGPVFFRQLRVGRHGRRFYMLKFRTMVDGAEAMKDALRDRNEAQDGLFKIVADPRVTRVGRLLRTTAMDELPQLLNIVKGEMSLVGPRPLVIEEDERICGWNRRRLELMPGMTGPWQILGPARVPLNEMVALDYLYVANWSLWSDVKLLLRTVPHVLGRQGL
jgi:exopolysaccharide biosynthesis polyprenyl glycosylphosphotransferase